MVTEEQEQALIDAGAIRATGFRYVGECAAPVSSGDQPDPGAP
jgi:hypothetical protein